MRSLGATLPAEVPAKGKRRLLTALVDFYLSISSDTPCGNAVSVN
jgi:hypothetical protein